MTIVWLTSSIYPGRWVCAATPLSANHLRVVPNTHTHVRVFQLLEIYVKYPAVESEVELQMFLMNASFASVAGRGS